MAAKTRKWLLAFAALGLGASSWSSYVHYSLLTQPGYTSFCDVNNTISCTQAYLSPYGSLWGIPVALGGVLYFAFVLLMAGSAAPRPPQAAENVPGYIFAVSTVALAVVLYLAWASFFRLHALCMLCAVTYVAVIGIFLISSSATRVPISSLPGRAARDTSVLLKSPVALVLALVFGVGAVTLIYAFPRDAHSSAAAPPPRQQFPPLTDQQRTAFIQWLDLQPRLEIPVDSPAKVTFVKFNDYQCPACRDTYFLYRDVAAKYAAGGQVKFVTRHYPLESECNGSVPGGNHFVACEAAAAMVMAASKGTADKLEEWLFTNQASLTTASVKQAAADVAGITDFDAQYAQALVKVRADADLGTKLKVGSTPTFFLNGRKMDWRLPPPALEAAIDHELSK